MAIAVNADVELCGDIEKRRCVDRVPIECADICQFAIPSAEVQDVHFIEQPAWLEVGSRIDRCDVPRHTHERITVATSSMKQSTRVLSISPTRRHSVDFLIIGRYDLIVGRSVTL